MIQKTVTFLLILLTFVLDILIPKNKKMIIFESFLGKGINDNPKAIYDYMLENNYDYQFIWSVNRNTKLDYYSNIKTINRFSLKWFFYMYRAKFWVTNSRFPIWIRKGNKTIYIQTWHGTPLKKIGIDIENNYMFQTDTDKYKKEFIKEAQRWNYLVSPNSYSSEIFKNAFNYKNKILETGYPRNDILINQNNNSFTSTLKKNLKIPMNKKVILYAPTWRDNEFDFNGNYILNPLLNINKLKAELSDEYILLIRHHYLISSSVKTDNTFSFNVSSYSNINELFLISDLLITDYSSVFFDYSILKRPIIFYPYDREVYEKKLRGFYFNYDKVPGPIVYDIDSLIEVIKKSEYNTNDYKKFYSKFNSLEKGISSQNVVESIFNK